MVDHNFWHHIYPDRIEVLPQDEHHRAGLRLVLDTSYAQEHHRETKEHSLRWGAASQVEKFLASKGYHSATPDIQISDHEWTITCRVSPSADLEDHAVVKQLQKIREDIIEKTYPDIERRAFLLARHAETTDNEETPEHPKKVISGRRSDPDITDAGRKKSRQVGETFALLENKPMRVVVSALKRTPQTAKEIVGHENFIVEPDLDERDLGELDGKITEEEQKQRVTLPGEEPASHHRARVIQGLNRQLRATPEKEMPLIVAHGGTARRVLESVGIRGDEAGRVKINNSQLYKFVPTRGREGWKIYELGQQNGVLKEHEITPKNVNKEAGWEIR